MKNWINKNYKTLIIAAFLVPIITVAIVSISHVTIWYGISNPVTWSVYLSIGIEIAALSALAAISANMGSKVYFPFAIVTIVQFIGNIFFAYTFIDINSQQFKDWVDLVSPLVEYMGVEPTDFVGHKRFLAFFAGGMLPVISLSFLHMLVKFTEEDRKKQIDIKEEVKETINEIVKEPEQTESKIDASDLVSEISRLRLSENDLKTLEEVLLNPPPPNERLVEAAKRYQEKTKKESELSDDEILKRAEEIRLKKIFEKSEEIKKSREEKNGPDNVEDEPSALANSQYREEYFEKEISEDSTINEDIVETNDKEKQRELLVQMMEEDEKDGLYDDWDSTFNDGLDDESIEHPIEDDDLFHYIPTEEEEQQNFSTIEEDSTNIFHDEEVINETPISVEEKTLNLRQVVFEESTILETPQIEVVSNVEEPQPQSTPLIENEEVEKKNF
jgi:hypothetical protein